MKDANKKTLKIGDKVHPLGRGDKILYVIKLGERMAGVSSDKVSSNGYGVSYNRLVKMKNQKSKV